MSLTRWDILVKADDFAAVAERARLSRWKWEMLEAIDGARNLGAVAARALLDVDSALTFAEEALAANLVRIVTLSYREFHGVEDTVDAVAVPPPEAAPEPVPEPEPVVIAVAEPAPEPEPEPEPVLFNEPEPVPEPVVVADVQPEPEPEPVAAVQAPPPAPTSLAERMAALRARALKSVEQKPAPAAYPSVEPPPRIEPVEFSLSSEPKPEPARSADEIEFSV